MSKTVIRCALLAGASLLVAAPALAQADAAPANERSGAAPAPEPAAPAAQTPPPSEPGTGGVTGLQEIVVTAQRRAENLQKVPVAVTALSAAKLDDLRVVSAQNLSGLAPSLTINNQGLASNPTIIIRGIASGVSNNSVDPKVGVYLDGVYIGRTVGSLFDLADIQRIEVLRGPQGTLFGRNATGGAISIVTAPPKGEFGVRGTLSYGNYDAKRGKVSIDLPKVGPFSARVSYLHDDIDGDYRNLIGGQSIDLSPRDPSFGVQRYAKRLGGHNTDAGQIAVRGEFGNVTADYHFDYSDQRSVGRPIQAFGTPTDPANQSGPIVSTVELYDALTGAGISNNSTSRLKAVANATSRERVVTQGHSLTLTARDDDNGIVVKSITAYRKFKQYPNIYDLAASGGLRFTGAQLQDLVFNGGANLFNPAIAPGANDSFFTLLTSRKTRQEQISEEAQIQITKHAFDLTAGVFIFHENSPATDILGIFQPVANGVVVTNPLLDAIFGSGVTQTKAVNDSVAGYAQATLHLGPTVDLTGGARYTFDDRESKITSVSGGQGGSLGPGDYKVNFHKLTYTGIATWRPTQRITAYAKIATGYVAGGILSAIPYKPETLTTYELGFKSQLLDNRLRLNLAAYYSKYNDLQVQIFNRVQSFRNAGKANIKGFEAEIEAVPVTGLTLSGNISYTDFTYKKFIIPDPTDTTGSPGNIDVASVARTTYAPKWQGRGSVQYDMAPFANGSHVFARLDGTYRGKIPLVFVPFTGVSAPIEKSDIRNAIFLVDARIGLAGWSLGGAKVALSAFGQNLTNRRYADFGANVLRLVGSFERGRTYGVELGFEF